MRIYDLVILEQGYTTSNDDNLRSVQEWNIARNRILSEDWELNFDLYAEVAAPENFSAEPWFNQLNPSSYPVLLIADRETGVLLVHMSGQQITAANIYDAIRQIADLNYSDESGDFIFPDGQPVGGDGIWPGGRGGFGPSWLLLVLLGGLIISSK